MIDTLYIILGCILGVGIILFIRRKRRKRVDRYKYIRTYPPGADPIDDRIEFILGDPRRPEGE